MLGTTQEFRDGEISQQKGKLQMFQHFLTQTTKPQSHFLLKPPYVSVNEFV